MKSFFKAVLFSLLIVLNMGFAEIDTRIVHNTKPSQSAYLNEVVFYNTASHKFHKMSCIWAARCTKNCIPKPRGEALQMGVACKVCGG